MMKILRAFDEKEMAFFEPTEKIGLLATVNPNGLPHITLITAMQAKTRTQMIWGQFTEGHSKRHVLQNTNTGFLILTIDRKMWRGKASYTHFVKEGEDYQMFNDKPMFRYNSYFGIHTIHYMDLLETFGQEALPLAQIAASSIISTAARFAVNTHAKKRILKPWAQGLFNRLGSLKFLSYVDADGYPVIIPIIQCQAAGSGRLVFSHFAYPDELAKIPQGASVAVFCITTSMEDVLVRGTYHKKGGHAATLGFVDIDWVYNSMPPCHGQIYPPLSLEPVTDFTTK